MLMLILVPFRPETGLVQFWLTNKFPDSAFGALVPGPDFTAAVRTSVVFTFTSGDDVLTVTGITDATDPYSWTPSNAEEVKTWASNRSAGDSVTAALTYTPAVTLADAVAPTVTVGSIVSINEGTSTNVGATVSGGSYDTISYLWTVVSGGGTLTNTTLATATYTAPAVASNTTVVVRCTVTVAGTGTNAVADSTASANDTESFTVTNVVGLAAAVAPSVSINSVGTINEGNSKTLSAVLSGGTYDTISYNWTEVGAEGVIFSPTAATPTYRASAVTQDTTEVVTLTVTVAGTGTNATNGTSATASDTESFTVINTLANATAPTLSLSDPDSINESTSVDVIATVASGSYDTISYAWTVTTGGGTLTNASAATATYAAPVVASDTSVTLSCTVTVTGTGTNAFNGTSATVTSTRTFSVLNVAALGDAVAPTVAIDAVTTVESGGAITLGATITGGTYDTLAYNWFEVGDEGVITNNTTATPTYTANSVTEDTNEAVYLTVTAAGTGTNAASGSSATITDSEFFTITAPVVLADAVAPTVVIDAVSTVESGAAITLGATITGGTYDTISYYWFELGDEGVLTNKTTATPTYTAANVTEDTDEVVTLSVVVGGTGTNAANGSTATVSDTESFTIVPENGADMLPEGEGGGAVGTQAVDPDPVLQQEPMARDILSPRPDVRLIPFEFSNDDTYTLEFSDRVMRVIRNRELVRDKSVTPVTVTSSATPVFTSTAHGLANNDEVFLLGFKQMRELNGRWCVVNSVTADTFELAESSTGEALDTSGYIAETMGGVVDRIYKKLSPYIEEDLASIKYVQNADVMTLTSPYYLAYELRRLGHSDWGFVPVTFSSLVTGPTGVVSDNEAIHRESHNFARYQVTGIDGSTEEESLPGTTEWIKTDECSIVEESSARKVTYTGKITWAGEATGSTSSTDQLLILDDFDDLNPVLPLLWFAEPGTSKAVRPQRIASMELTRTTGKAQF